MTEDKKKRLVVAGTVGAVVLIFVLLSIMCIQLIKISTIRQQTRELDLAIAKYNRLIKEGEDTLEARSTAAWIAKRAYELGYVFKGDQNLT